MKVIHNCSVFNFHEDYCINIHEELLSRGHESIIERDGRVYPDADFTIQPDENCKNLGGKGIWIGHAIPVIPQNSFYYYTNFYHDLHKNCDYIFAYSDAWVEFHKLHDLPTFSVGLPKLDKLFNTIEGGSILFAPTHHKKPSVYSAEKVNIEKLKSYGLDVIVRGHPAFNHDQMPLLEALKKSSLVISDYSSVGLEAIALNIPTILIGDKKWENEKPTVSIKAEKGAIRVYDSESLYNAINHTLENPKELEFERLEASKLLCSHLGNASKVTVDKLEEIYNA